MTTLITQGNSSTGTLNYLDSVTVEAGSGFARFESPSGTIVAEFSGVRTFGPFSNRTYRVVSILGTIKYAVNDDFPSGSIVQAIAVMGSSGAITGLLNPDGTTSILGGGGVSTIAATTDATTYDLPTNNAPLLAALALKAALLAPVDLGTGAIALTAAAHANHANRWNGSGTPTATITTTGGVVGDLYAITNNGTGTITMPGTAGTGYQLTILPNTTGIVEWEGSTTFISQIPSPGAGVAPLTISGAAPVGSTLTAAYGTGYLGTLQWQENIAGTWTNIAGQTATTYVTTTASRAYRCVLASIYSSNTITSAVAAPVFTAQTAPAGTVGTAYTYPYAASNTTSFALNTGTLPAGLTLNTGTGVLSGTPTTAAVSTFTINATGAGGTTSSTSQSVTIAAAGIADNFNRANGALGTRSDGGAWTLATGTAPVISSNTLIAGAAAGCIFADLGHQNGTYSIDINTTTSAFNPLMRLCSDGSATKNYIGIAIDPIGATWGVSVFTIDSVGTFVRQLASAAVFTSGVTGTLSVVVTGAPSAVSLNVKFNGTTITGGGAVTGVAMNTVASLAGATMCGVEVAASGVTYDNFSAV
jgi:hypothetical protein